MDFAFAFSGCYVSLSFTVPAYKGPPAPTPAPTATTTTVTTRPHYFEDDRAEI